MSLAFVGKLPSKRLLPNRLHSLHEEHKHRGCGASLLAMRGVRFEKIAVSGLQEHTLLAVQAVDSLTWPSHIQVATSRMSLSMVGQLAVPVTEDRGLV